MVGIFTSDFQIITTNYFQATGQSFKASVLSVLRQLIVLIPMIVILLLFFGLDGILYAGPIADISSIFIILYFALSEIRRLNAKVSENTLT